MVSIIANQIRVDNVPTNNPELIGLAMLDLVEKRYSNNDIHLANGGFPGYDEEVKENKLAVVRIKI